MKFNYAKVIINEGPEPLLRRVKCLAEKTFQHISPSFLTKPQLIIFDYDNTLVDSWPQDFETSNEVFKALGCPPMDVVEMTNEETDTPESPECYRPYLSKTGRTYGLSFCIGNKAYLGKGFAAPTLESFMKFFVEQIDPQTDLFFIDPFLNNPRAIHVYKKAGFEIVSEFTQEGGYFDKNTGVLMVKKLPHATIESVPQQ